MMLTNNKKISLTLVVCLLLLLSTTIAFAWLSYGGDVDHEISIGGLSGNIDYQFDDGVTNIDKPSDALNSFRLIEINGVSKDQIENPTGYFLDDLKIGINIELESVSYVRVKVQDEWEITRHYDSIDRVYSEVSYLDTTNYFPYDLVNSDWEKTDDCLWYFDRDTGYVYYTSFLEKGNYNLPFMYGGQGYIPKFSTSYYDTCILRLNFKVEIVQANRFKEVWNISKIPGGDIE